MSRTLEPQTNSPSVSAPCLPFIEWQGDVLMRVDPAKAGVAKYQVLGRVEESFGMYKWQQPNTEDGWWKDDLSVRPASSVTALKDMMFSRYSA